MFRFLNNDAPVRSVFGQARVRDFRGYGHAMEEHAVAYIEFEGGVRGLLDGGRAIPNSGAMTLLGSEGTIRLDDELKLTITNKSGCHLETHPYSRRGGENWLGLWSDMLDDLIAWIEGGPEPELGLTNMLKTSELNLAAYISACRGDRIDLPLEDEVDEWPVEELARRFSGRGPTCSS